jgi:superfamily II RNA helicase
LVLNLLLSHSPPQIEDLLEKSFAAYHGQTLDNRGDRIKPPQKCDDLKASFLKHLAFLEATGYANSDGRLTADGVWASQLRVDLPLMTAQALRKDLFPHEDPACFAGIMASFVNEQESDNRISVSRQARPLLGAFIELEDGLHAFSGQLAAWGFSTRRFYLRPALAVYCWACGQPWESAMAVSRMEEGDLVMLILRTADNMRHVKTLAHVFPKASEAAARALGLILRDPVVMDYSL